MRRRRCPACKDLFNRIIVDQIYCSATCAKSNGALEEYNRVKITLDELYQAALDKKYGKLDRT